MNPKDQLGQHRLPVWLWPPIATMYGTVAMVEGAIKYGPWNWRREGAILSIYISAIYRHLAKFMEGEDRDDETGVPHLASVLANVAIILDAQLHGRLHDDRPIAVSTDGEGNPCIVREMQRLTDMVNNLRDQ